MRWTLLLCTVMVLLGSLLLVASGLALETEAADEDIGPIQCLAGDDNRTVQDIAVDGGRVYIVADNDGYNHGPDGVYLKYFDGGTWHDWIRVNDDPEFVGRRPRVDASDGRAHIVWDAKSSYQNFDVHYRTFEDGQWGPIVNVIPHDDFYWAAQDYCDVAVEGDDVFIVWISRHDYSGYLYCRWTDGDEWGDATLLDVTSGTNTSMGQPRISIAEGRAYLVWPGGEVGNANLFVRVHDGKEWLPRWEMIDGGTGLDRIDRPTIDVDGDAIHVAWSCSINKSVRGAWYLQTTEGRQGTPLAIADQNGLAPFWPSVAAEEGRVIVAGIMGSLERGDIFITFKDGSRWGPVRNITRDMDDGRVHIPSISINNGTAHIAWTAYDTDNNYSTFYLEVDLDDDVPDASLEQPLDYWFDGSGTDIRLSALDDMFLSNVTVYYRHCRDNVSWTRWKVALDVPLDEGQPLEGHFRFFPGDGDGFYQLQACARDIFGRGEPLKGPEVMTAMDTTPPTGSLCLEGGAMYAPDATVRLWVRFEDEMTGTIANELGRAQHRYRLGNSADLDHSPWQPAEPVCTWAVAPGEGERTVFLQVMDLAGLVSGISSCTFIVDTTPPTCSIEIEGGARIVGESEVIVTLAFDDALSGVSQMRLSDDGVMDSEPWIDVEARTRMALAGGEGERTACFQVRDRAGHPSPVATDKVLVDLAPPTGSLRLVPDLTYVRSVDVRLAIEYSDNVSGVDSMRLSSDGIWDGEPWTGPVNAAKWTLGKGDGDYFVYLQLRDVIGHLSGVIVLSATVDTVAPTIQESLPSDGERNVPVPCSISVRFSEEMDSSSLGEALRVYSNDERIDGTLEYRDGLLTFAPSGTLLDGCGYVVVIETSARDLAGNQLEGPVEIAYITERTDEAIDEPTWIPLSMLILTILIVASAMVVLKLPLRSTRQY